MKTIMLVAGGKWQVPLAKKIKSMGHKLVCSNLYEDSPAFAYADICEVANVLDVEKNIDFAKKYNVDAVVSDQSDISMISVATIAKTLSLQSNGLDIAQLMSDKILMREFCASHNFPSTKHKACSNKADVEKFLNTSADKRIIIKPHNSQSSRGVHIIENQADIDLFFADSLSYTHGDNKIIAEYYIVGTEFTIDGIFINGKHHSLAISKKKHFDFLPSVASELLFSQNDSDFDYDELKRQNDEIMNATGAKMGLSHNEYKFSQGKFRLIEMSNRGGGNRIASDIVPLMSGVDNYAIYINQSLGNTININDFNKGIKQSFCMLKFIDNLVLKTTAKAKIMYISGVDIVCKHKNIIDFCVNYNVGDIISPIGDDSTRKLYYIAQGKSLEEIYETEHYILQNLKINYEQL